MGINLDILGKTFGPFAKEYDWKDVVLYALGVGAGAEELEYVYEKDLQVIPSFAVLSAYDLFPEIVSKSGINLAGLLHGEHDLLIHKPIPPEGTTLTTKGRISQIYDKGEGKGALVIAEVETHTSEGEKLFTNVVTLFARLDGGFGGEDSPKEVFSFPDRPPDFEEDAQPSIDQPLIYRLSGDTFALHVDPDFAKVSGFERPIMHGLCTHGYACRAVVKHLFPGEPERMTKFRNRFSRALYPGCPIKTQIWKLEEGKALFRTINTETSEVVLDRGIVEWISTEELKRRRALGAINFEGRVAIVTGAGGGLGRAYALGLAARGAKVVVNDYGGARDGSGKGSERPADEVVKEIQEAGGEAVANYDTVATQEGGERIVQTALEHYGKVDILINNAGILRDKSFAKMTSEMWEEVLAVHLRGAFNVTQPAFSAMREGGYGRIVMTTSAAGLYGNFGQTNYGGAKMGVVGMMNTLKLEGEKYNIKVNTVAPLAATRLTEDVMPADLLERLKPELAAPLVLYLCSEQCKVSGHIYNTGAGYHSRASILSGPGVWIGDEEHFPTPEDVAAQWDKIISAKNVKEYPNANAALMAMMMPSEEAEESEAPQAGGGSDVKGIFDQMPEHFQKGAAAGVDVVFQFSISGSGGGDWHVTVKGGECEVGTGVHSKPTTTIKMTDEDFLQYVAGKLPAMQAYTAGRLKVEGDLMKSQLIEKIFKF
jgi:NAD(P)-dependent dehydrogenase (short-subunit alcohol dehydrogenase family)/acyl dehydratase/putative sterol carrier protein